MANRTLAVVRRMFRFAVDRDVVDHNPFLGIGQDPASSSQSRRARSNAANASSRRGEVLRAV